MKETERSPPLQFDYSTSSMMTSIATIYRPIIHTCQPPCRFTFWFHGRSVRSEPDSTLHHGPHSTRVATNRILVPHVCPDTPLLDCCHHLHQRSARTCTKEPTDMRFINIDHHGHRIDSIDIATTVQVSRCRYSCRCRVLVTSKASRIALHSIPSPNEHALHSWLNQPHLTSLEFLRWYEPYHTRCSAPLMPALQSPPLSSCESKR